MNVDHSASVLFNESWRQDTHEAGKNDQVYVAPVDCSGKFAVIQRTIGERACGDNARFDFVPAGNLEALCFGFAGNHKLDGERALRHVAAGAAGERGAAGALRPPPQRCRAARRLALHLWQQQLRPPRRGRRARPQRACARGAPARGGRELRRPPQRRRHARGPRLRLGLHARRPLRRAGHGRLPQARARAGRPARAECGVRAQHHGHHHARWPSLRHGRWPPPPARRRLGGHSRGAAPPAGAGGRARRRPRPRVRRRPHARTARRQLRAGRCSGAVGADAHLQPRA